MVAMSWVSLNAQWAIASGAIHFEHKPTSVDDCSYNFDANSMVNITKIVGAE